jgi:hypothetical protein
VEDKRTPDELIAIIESQAEAIREALVGLKNKGV